VQWKFSILDAGKASLYLWSWMRLQILLAMGFWGNLFPHPSSCSIRLHSFSQKYCIPISTLIPQDNFPFLHLPLSTKTSGKWHANCPACSSDPTV